MELGGDSRQFCHIVMYYITGNSVPMRDLSANAVSLIRVKSALPVTCERQTAVQDDCYTVVRSSYRSRKCCSPDAHKLDGEMVLH